MWSFALRQSFLRGMMLRVQVALDKYIHYAEAVINCMLDHLAPSGYMRYATEGNFMFATYASASLIKVSQMDLTLIFLTTSPAVETEIQHSH